MNFFEIMNELHIPLMTITKAPTSSGVYLLFDANGEFIYVGKAKNLKQRLAQHFSGSEKNPVIQKYATFTLWETTNSLEDAEREEGAIFDSWVKITGTVPIANRIAPPKASAKDFWTSFFRNHPLFLQRFIQKEKN